MKTYFPVVPKRKPSPGALNSSERCVGCGLAFVDFADIFGSGRVLGCYSCGAVFMSQECREHDKALKREQLEEQGGKLFQFEYSGPKQGETTITIQSDVLTKIGGMETINALLESTTETEDTGLVTTAVVENEQETFTAKCGKPMGTDKKRKQHEAVCKKCKAI